MPGKHSKGSRARMFSIVIHDIKPTAKQHFENVINALTPDWSLIAEEEYNHQEGSHLHIFIKYEQPRSWKQVLSFCEKQQQGGRVQVDIGKGTFEQCKKYLTDPDKEKKLDNNITENVRKLTVMDRYPDDVSKCPDCCQQFFNPPFRFIKNIWLRAEKCFKCSKKKISGHSICKDATNEIV